MKFTLMRVLDSLAGVLKKGYPEYPVYIEPGIQETELPCFFLFLMPSEISGETGGRYLRDLGVDIVFVQQRNIQDGNRGMLSVAEYLDGALDCFPYTDGSGDTALIRTFERNWKTEDQVLHYQFHIRQRAAVPGESDYMREMEENHAGIKKQK